VSLSLTVDESCLYELSLSVNELCLSFAEGSMWWCRFTNSLDHTCPRLIRVYECPVVGPCVY